MTTKSHMTHDIVNNEEGDDDEEEAGWALVVVDEP